MNIRVTGILLSDDKILLLDQDVENSRSWSLPGGKVEENETLEAALKREMKEETGLEVDVQRLLYVCDHITEKAHILHITFEVKETGGKLGDLTLGVDTNKIRSVEFVSLADITSLGFSSKFQKIVQDGFPKAGNYMGAKSNIGL
jgi:ADP-ribose pyrophosphatase YjhB (NUDIX family)